MSIEKPDVKPWIPELFGLRNQIQEIERFYEMKDQNRADEWDDSKSRLFGFLKFRRNRKMKHDRYSKRLKDIHIQNMKLHEEFVTEFSVDGKYKVWLDYTHSGLKTLQWDARSRWSSSLYCPMRISDHQEVALHFTNCT